MSTASTLSHLPLHIIVTNLQLINITVYACEGQCGVGGHFSACFTAHQINYHIGV